MTSIPEYAAQRMEYWCTEANLGYDQPNRWAIYPGGSADCSSLTAHCYNEAGIQPQFPRDSRTWTGTWRALALARGFSVVSGTNLQRGDIVLNERRHVAMYLGNGLLGYASQNEFGGISGGRGGDQTGRETKIAPYYNFGQNVFLRYTKGGNASSKAASSSSQTATNSKTKLTPTLLEEIAAMKATHIIFQVGNDLYLANVLAGTYRKIPNVKTLNDLQTVISRSGGVVKYWKALGAKSDVVANPAAFGVKIG